MSNQDYKNAALQALKGNWAQAVLLALVYLALVLFFAGPYYAWSFRAGEDAAVTAFPVWQYGLLFGGYILFLIPLSVGIVNAFLALLRTGDNNLTANSFRLGFSKGYLRNLAAMLLVCLFVFLWSLLLIVPGIIMGLAYAMVPYLIQDHPEMGLMEAIKTSRKMMKGHKFDLFYLQLSFIGWAFLCVLTLCIGYLWLFPYMEAALTAFYEDVHGQYLQAAGDNA